MEQRDINSRTRADTFGLRPDLYDALSGNMVKQTDVGAAAGTAGYGQFSTGPVSFTLGNGVTFGNPVVKETSDLKGVHFGSCGWGSFNNVNIELSGAVIDSPGLWACIPYFKADMTGTGFIGAMLGLTTNIKSQSPGYSSNSKSSVNFTYNGNKGDASIGISTNHVIPVTQEQVDGGAGIFCVVSPDGGEVKILEASLTVFRIDSDWGV